MGWRVQAIRGNNDENQTNDSNDFIQRFGTPQSDSSVMEDMLAICYCYASGTPKKAR
jgi:hypothetical protein